MRRDFALSDGTYEIAVSDGKAKGIMKKLILVVIAMGAVFGLGLLLNPPHPRPAPVAEAIPEASEQTQIGQPAKDPPEPLPQPAPTSAVPKPVSRPVAASAHPTLDASFVGRVVDTLISPQATYQQKQEAFKQLREAGKLDQAITELEQRVSNEPRSAESAAALGQAYLQKCGTIQDLREQGILAMQADKVFETALSLDPSNWEARFTKAVAMSYWPPMLNKGDEVIQNFQTLIQQQENQPQQQPQFADTYAWLGDQYQKSNRAEDARTIWQRGLTFFPTDEKLRNKLQGPQ